MKRTAREHRRALRRFPPKFDVRQLVKAQIDKRGRELRAFETLSEAKKENRHRARLLHDAGTASSIAIAQVLEPCSYSAPCGSLACARCARWRRIVYSASVLLFLDRYDLADMRLVTLINPGDAIPAGELHTFNPRHFIHRLRRQLERAGITKNHCFLIGAVDGEWDEGWLLFQPHIHLIAYGITNDDLKRLIKSWPRDPKRVRLRKRRDPIDDLPRVVAYLDKSFWPSVARKHNPLGIHPHGKRRPPKHIEREVLHWFHHHRPSDLRFMYGVKSYHGTLVKN